jgi:hypothetical protein
MSPSVTSDVSPAGATVLAAAQAALDAYEYDRARELLEAALVESRGGLDASRALLELLVDVLGLDAEALAVAPKLARPAQRDLGVRSSTAELVESYQLDTGLTQGALLVRLPRILTTPPDVTLRDSQLTLVSGDAEVCVIDIAAAQIETWATAPLPMRWTRAASEKLTCSRRASTTPSHCARPSGSTTPSRPSSSTPRSTSTAPTSTCPTPGPDHWRGFCWAARDGMMRQAMTGKDKDEAARDLIQHHFAVEPELRAVYRIMSANETSPDEPIKLLEVNAATVATGSVEVFGFAASKSTPFSVMIAEVTPDELEQLKSNPRAMPHGWSLAQALVFERGRAA